MDLIEQIKDLKKTSIRNVIESKIVIFSSFKDKPKEDFFFELCFCLLTANFSAKRAIEIQEKVGFEGFVFLSQEELALRLREVRYRFPNKRAEYIVLARKHLDGLKDKLFSFKTDFERRDWLVENVKGLGMKESSHFLRNVGFFDVAILDFHIIDILVENNVIEKLNNRSLSRKMYLDVESKLVEFSKELELSQGELDFYLWYLETGEVLK